MAIKRLFCTTCDREYVIDKQGYLNTPCPVCSTDLLDEKPFSKCDCCGMKLDDGVKLCTSCGTFIGSKEQSSLCTKEEKAAVLKRALTNLGAGLGFLFFSLVVFAATKGISGEAPLPIALIFKLFGPDITLTLCFGFSVVFLVLFLNDIVNWSKMKTY